MTTDIAPSWATNISRPTMEWVCLYGHCGHIFFCHLLVSASIRAYPDNIRYLFFFLFFISMETINSLGMLAAVFSLFYIYSMYWYQYTHNRFSLEKHVLYIYAPNQTETLKTFKYFCFVRSPFFFILWIQSFLLLFCSIKITWGMDYIFF